MQNRHQSRMRAGYRLEVLDAEEFALKRAVVIEAVATDDFGGAERAQDAAGQPDFPAGALADTPKQFVIGDHRVRCLL
jgi:hypothetical protein